jgi:hypothetical protein
MVKPSRLHVLYWPDLGLALELRPVDPVQFHELPGDGIGLFLRLRLDERVAADNFFGLRKRYACEVGLSPPVSLRTPLANILPTNSPMASISAFGGCVRPSVSACLMNIRYFTCAGLQSLG